MAAPNPSLQRADCAKILRWWDRHGRNDLPWQRRRTPYTALVAELMLQQTTVATVLPRYVSFLRRFPGVKTLARASLDEVLQEWQGLGYYARARSLHRACQQVAQRGCRWPVDAKEWLELPGVGRSTANAIAASLSDKPHAILDGNVKRVLARRFAVAEPINEDRTLARLWSIAEVILPARRGRDFAQAMMDLGATVCKPKRPDCEHCPLRSRCQARLKGLIESIPSRAPARAKRRQESWLLLVRRGNGRCLLGPRPLNGVWGGLWTPPLAPGKLRKASLRKWLRENLGIDGEFVAPPGRPIRHELTHIKMVLRPVEFAAAPLLGRQRLPSKIAHPESDMEYSWQPPANVPGGLPTPIRELLAPTAQT